MAYAGRGSVDARPVGRRAIDLRSVGLDPVGPGSRRRGAVVVGVVGVGGVAASARR
jgi:hypothetical protein